MKRSDVDHAWEKYLEAERDRIRSVTLERLGELVNALHAVSDSERKAWVVAYCSASVDAENLAPVRFPLFREVLFPVLVAGHRNGDPGFSRWLAGFSQLLYKSPECQLQLPNNERTEIGLLMSALKVDPNDRAARSKLILAVKWQLEYSLHEIPSGVLFGSDGATIDECQELMLKLSDFEKLVQDQGCEEEHLELISYCRYHYKMYPAYLARSAEFGSYTDYLACGGSVLQALPPDNRACHSSCRARLAPAPLAGEANVRLMKALNLGGFCRPGPRC